MYESPINIIVNDIAKILQEKQENYVMECVRNIGVDVDKGELVRALNYDREQYEKGYKDGLYASRWIPVSERLPKQQQTVLIQDFGNVTIGYLNGENKWRDLTNLDDYLKGVEAWMPLPEPYKESEG